jgi:hypothetical protein
MATITITIPDSKAPEVLNRYSKMTGYKDLIDGQPNPESKAQFSKRRIVEHIKETIRGDIRDELNLGIESQVKSDTDALEIN